MREQVIVSSNTVSFKKNRIDIYLKYISFINESKIRIISWYKSWEKDRFTNKFYSQKSVRIKIHAYRSNTFLQVRYELALSFLKKP